MNSKKNKFDRGSILVHKETTKQSMSKKHKIHMNGGHELYLLLKGDVSFRIDGNIYNLMPGDMLLIGNTEVHQTIVNKDDTYERNYIYFDPKYIEQFESCDYSLLSMFSDRNRGCTNKISRELVKEYDLQSYFDKMNYWYQSNAPEKQIMMASILLQLLVKINTIHSLNNKARHDKLDTDYNDKIYEVIRYISTNLDSKITLESLEKRFFINKYYLCHLFKRTTGFTIIDYINEKKIHSAKEQLKKGKPISDVWIQYGFLNYSSFYKTFIKIEGISPTKYISETFIEQEKVM